MRAVPWAWWDGDLKAWQVPFRSWEELLKRWPTIEAAAQRHASGERKKRQQARIGSPEHREAVARAAERRRRRYPVPDDPLPPLDRVVMTTAGAVIFTEVTGELADSDTAARFYPEISQAGLSLVWEPGETYPQGTHQGLACAPAARSARPGVWMVAAKHRRTTGQAPRGGFPRTRAAESSRRCNGQPTGADRPKLSARGAPARSSGC
jgi:hypothetical protein